MKRVPLLSTLLLVLLAVACKTGGTRVAPVATAPSDLLAPYVGELRLFRHGAEQATVRLDARSRPPGACTVAVRVGAAAFVKGAAHLSLETLGTPRLREQRARCKRVRPQVDLTLSGFSSNPDAAEVRARLDAALQTPEAYLAERGIRFDLAPGELPTEVASQETFATSTEARLGERVRVWPVPLLAVDPWYHTRRLRQQSEVELDAIVGADGRLHRPRLRTVLGEAHAACVLRTLPLWRFEPARRAEGPIAARVSLRPVLNLY